PPPLENAGEEVVEEYGPQITEALANAWRVIAQFATSLGLSKAAIDAAKHAEDDNGAATSPSDAKTGDDPVAQPTGHESTQPAAAGTALPPTDGGPTGDDQKSKGTAKDASDTTTEVSSGTSRAPMKGEPNSIYEQVDPNGNLRSRTFYDDNGNSFT